MTIFDYISFLTVAECKSITAAADKLHLTKSAVSHNLSKIEKELDVPPLFPREQQLGAYQRRRDAVALRPKSNASGSAIQ